MSIMFMPSSKTRVDRVKKKRKIPNGAQKFQRHRCTTEGCTMIKLRFLLRVAFVCPQTYQARNDEKKS